MVSYPYRCVAFKKNKKKHSTTHKTSSVYAESFEIFTFAYLGVLVAVPHPVVDAAGVVRQLVPAQPPAPPAPPHVRHPWW